MINNKASLLFFLFYIVVLSGCKPAKDADTNQVSDDRMLIVLSAPSVNDSYYSTAFQQIVDFQIMYAKAIIGNDNVVVITDAATRPYYKNKLPHDVLITSVVYDIWLRDFSTVNPLNPVSFKYTWASMTQAESIEVQNSFNEFADYYNIEMNSSALLLDGGNLVDNYHGKVITTARFLTDNGLTKAAAIQQLQTLLNATEVAIIEPDEPVLGHADGMVMWADENTLLVNDYSDDPVFRTTVLDELQSAFPGIEIIEVPVVFSNNGWPGFESACGVNINSLVTFNNIYVPVFDMPHSADAVELISQHTTKNVITISADNVCPMGGSVRCLAWQLSGDNARKLIEAARFD
jgi:agmatine/peptidylarginine deiminase